MDSEIKPKIGALLKIGNWMLLLWITHCLLILVCTFLLTPNTTGALAIDALNSDAFLAEAKDLKESL